MWVIKQKIQKQGAHGVDTTLARIKTLCVLLCHHPKPGAPQTGKDRIKNNLENGRSTHPKKHGGGNEPHT